MFPVAVVVLVRVLELAPEDGELAPSHVQAVIGERGMSRQRLDDHIPRPCARRAYGSDCVGEMWDLVLHARVGPVWRLLIWGEPMLLVCVSNRAGYGLDIA